MKVAHPAILMVELQTAEPQTPVEPHHQLADSLTSFARNRDGHVSENADKIACLIKLKEDLERVVLNTVCEVESMQRRLVPLPFNIGESCFAPVMDNFEKLCCHLVSLHCCLYCIDRKGRYSARFTIECPRPSTVSSASLCGVGA